MLAVWFRHNNSSSEGNTSERMRIGMLGSRRRESYTTLEVGRESLGTFIAVARAMMSLDNHTAFEIHPTFASSLAQERGIYGNYSDMQGM